MDGLETHLSSEPDVLMIFRESDASHCRQPVGHAREGDRRAGIRSGCEQEPPQYDSGHGKEAEGQTREGSRTGMREGGRRKEEAASPDEKLRWETRKAWLLKREVETPTRDKTRRLCIFLRLLCCEAFRNRLLRVLACRERIRGEGAAVPLLHPGAPSLPHFAPCIPSFLSSASEHSSFTGGRQTSRDTFLACLRAWEASEVPPANPWSLTGLLSFDTFFRYLHVSKG